MLKLGKKPTPAKVTLDVVMRIETALRMGVLQSVRRLSAGELTTSNILNILTPAIRAGGNNVSEKEVSSMIWEAGLSTAMREAGQVLVVAMGGDSEDDKEGNDEKAEEVV